MPVTTGYQPEAWEAGPAAVIYDALATVVLERCPVALDGASFLDVGSGTGAAAKAARHAGARVIATDISPAMLAFERARRPAAAAADAIALPFRDESFDVVDLAFCLSHLHSPVTGLREAARVACSGGTVVVAGFGPADRHRVKDVLQGLLAERGWVPPPWYVHFKQHVEPLVAEPAALLELANAAGLADADASLVDVDLGERTPRQLARWRLGMAQVASFVEGLGPGAAAELEDAVATRLGDAPLRLVVQLALLVARRP